ncbi:DUF7168 domain-containing protein [Xanthomonas euvesicatoria]
MDRISAVRKVKACLRLGSSANVHEAAAAARQARLLMDKYGLSEAEISGIEFASAKTRARGADPNLSVIQLAQVIARGYRCSFLLLKTTGGPHGLGNSTEVEFCGSGADAEIAAYAFIVLRRQLDAERLAFTKRTRSATKRREKGEAFAQGWVLAVSQLFPAATLPEDIRARHERAQRERTPHITEGAARDPAKRLSEAKGLQDRLSGYLNGRKVRLSTAISGSSEPTAMLEGGL